MCSLHLITYSLLAVAALQQYEKLALSSIVPLVFVLELGITMGVHRLISGRQSLPCNACLRRMPEFRLNDYIRTFMALYLYSYSQIAITTLRYLQVLVRSLFILGRDFCALVSVRRCRWRLPRGVLCAGD